MEVTEIANLISHGGVVALAVVVWWELREHRRELGKHRTEEVESRKVLADAVGLIAKLVKRFDDEDAAKKSAEAAKKAVAEAVDFIREEISGVHDTPPDVSTANIGTPPLGVKKRARSNPGGQGGQGNQGP